MSLKCPSCGAALEPQISLKSLPQISPNSDEADLSIGSSSSDLDPPKRAYNQGYSAQFERFWEAFPLHRGKRNAFKAYLKTTSILSLKIASTTGATPEQAEEQAESAILAGAVRYAAEGHEARHTKYAEGWLNGERWEDDPLPRSNGSRSFYDRLGVTDG